VSVKNRLLAFASTLIVGLIVVGAIAWNSASSWSKDMHTIGDYRVPGLLALGNMNTERMVIRAQTLEVLLLELDYEAQEQFLKIKQQRENSWNVIEENWNNFIKLPRATKKGAQAAEKLTKQYKQWREVYVTLDALIDKLAKNRDYATQDALIKEYQTAYLKMIPISNAMGATMEEQIQTNKKNTLSMIEKATTLADAAEYSTLIIVLVVIVIAIIFTYTSITFILKSLRKVRSGLDGFFDFLNRESKHAAQIDLHSNDEFGQMAKMINKNMKEIEENIIADDKFVKDVAQFAKEIGNGNMLATIEKESQTPNLKELKKILLQMQYDLEHTIARSIPTLLDVLDKFKNQDFTARFPEPYAKVAVVINELGDVISALLRQSLEVGKTLGNSSSTLIDNVNLLNTSTNEAAASLEETAAALEEITSTVISNSDNVTQMSNYSSEVSNSAKKGQELAKNTSVAMDDITEQVNQINEAIGVIDQIAFQTNILSLNAAVEAATAGEAGKGFAVVAAEVRNLASRSAEAAKEIKDIVEQATLKANHGKGISDQMIKGYEELLGNINKTIQTIQEIAQASKEQEAGISQINDAVTGLDQQTQQNASIANQTKEIAMHTDAIAKEIVQDANSKKFTGKEDVQARDTNTKQIQTIQTGNTNNTKPKKASKPSAFEKKPSTNAKQEPKSSQAKTSNEDEWESF
jgi:methyl-accepting chemotaxis protein